nr:movement protein [Beet curly top Iran virus]
MVPFRVSEFPQSYPALLAVSTSCFLRYNKWCILGIQPEVLEPLTLEEGEDFLQFQKGVKKILKLKVGFKRKCSLYEELYQKYGNRNPKEKVPVCDQLVEEEEDDSWEDCFEEVPMEETSSK